MRKKKTKLGGLFVLGIIIIASYVSINMNSFEDVQQKKQAMSINKEVKEDQRDYVKDIEMARKFVTKAYQLISKGI